MMFLKHLPSTLSSKEIRSRGGPVVNHLACRATGPGSIPGLAATSSEIGYFLLPSRDMAERLLMQRKSSKQPTNQSKEMKLQMRAFTVVSAALSHANLNVLCLLSDTRIHI